MALDPEMTRLMLNWTQWRCGGSIRMAMSGAYDGMPRDPWDEPIPLMNGEAVDVEAAVERLEEHIRKATEEFWLRTGNARDKAKRCGCSEAALYRRLDQAHAFVRAYLNELRARGQRAKQALLHRKGKIFEQERETSRIIPLPLGLLRKGKT